MVWAILLSFLAGVTTVIYLEIQGLQMLLEPYYGLVEVLFGRN